MKNHSEPPQPYLLEKQDKYLHSELLPSTYNHSKMDMYYISLWRSKMTAMEWGKPQGISRLVIQPSPQPSYNGASDFIFPYEPSKQWDYRQAGTRVAVEDWLIKAVSHIHDSRNLSLELIPEVWWQ